MKICQGVLCLFVSDQALQQLKTPLWPRRFFLQLVDWRASVTARWRPRPLKLRPMFLPQGNQDSIKKKPQIEISLWHDNFAITGSWGACQLSNLWALRFRCRSHRSQISRSPMVWMKNQELTIWKNGHGRIQPFWEIWNLMIFSHPPSFCRNAGSSILFYFKNHVGFNF